MAKKRRTFTFSSIRKTMKKEGANIVSRNSVDILNSDLEAQALKISQKAEGFAKLRKAKTINKADVDLAIKYL